LDYLQKKCATFRKSLEIYTYDKDVLYKYWRDKISCNKGASLSKHPYYTFEYKGLMFDAIDEVVDYGELKVINCDERKGIYKAEFYNPDPLQHKSFQATVSISVLKKKFTRV